MDSMLPRPVLVVYARIDGAHFFTSLNVKGVCAASTDLHEAYDEVSVQLGEILSAQAGTRVVCEPQLPVEEFERWLQAQQGVAATRLESAAMARWALKQPAWSTSP